MTSNGTLEELQELVRKFCEERDWGQFHGAKDLAIGVITEAAELLEYFRFKSEAEVEAMLNSPVARAEIGQEMSDVLYFLLRLAQKYDIDLAREFKKKMQGNEAKYPVPRSKGLNKKYTEL